VKYYLYALILILSAAGATLVVPLFASISQNSLTFLQIPQNYLPQVAGIENVNLTPVNLGQKVPELEARSILVKDIATDTILYQKDVNFPVPIASTTKIMTALIGSDYFKPNSILTVEDSPEVLGSKVGLVRGEVLSFRSALYAMLLNSGNDAAFAIAENYPGGVLGFISQMNKKAQSLNLRNTHFDNPAGFDSPNHFASAADLAVITQEALKDPDLLRVFATKDTVITSLDQKYSHNLQNLNKLLWNVPGVLGVKTGFTDAAKENLVTLVERDGHQVLTIVLGSDDRFGESTKLINWVFQNFTWSSQSMNH